MTANFLDDFKSVQIFQMQMVTPNAANVVWQANFWVPKIPLKVMRKKTGIFGPKTPFSYMTQLLLLGKFEYGGGPIFKVVLEC